jgi:UDP-N-acetylglucosamine 2-epimerase (non-hydrolysing)/GDP/UDP-N,N'-diacetylbacillosamine 2-epimerase (hydrolysing)
MHLLKNLRRFRGFDLCGLWREGRKIDKQQLKVGAVSRRKICVVTTGRSDFGLLHGLMKCIQHDRALQLQVIVTGMHLAQRLGSTVQEVEDAGVKISRRIDLHLKGGTAIDNAKSIGYGVTAFAAAFADLKPAIVVLLGDRFELFAPAIAALMLRIPIAHIHGGERSEGAIDEEVRHAITKIASLHFAATEAYRRRIIQMGESPKRVFNFGAPGIDQLYQEPLMTRQELERDLKINFREPVALVTYHAETQDASNGRRQIETVLAAIERSGIKAVFTMANADAGGALINNAIRKACARHPERFRWAPNLGRRRYLSCLKHFSVMIGNSSSGLIEAPSFRLPAVNIGDRQRGRIRAKNIVDVARNEDAIRRGIRKALSSRFCASLRGMRNPYDRSQDGRASERIKNVLRDIDLQGEFLKKKFHDLIPVNSGGSC